MKYQLEDIIKRKEWTIHVENESELMELLDGLDCLDVCWANGDPAALNNCQEFSALSCIQKAVGNKGIWHVYIGSSYVDEYVDFKYIIKEKIMIKQGDLVEKYDGNDWDDNGGKGYKYGLNDRDFYNNGGEACFLVFADDEYHWCENVRPLNTKKSKALKRIENAEKELAEAKKELENE